MAFHSFVLSVKVGVVGDPVVLPIRFNIAMTGTVSAVESDRTVVALNEPEDGDGALFSVGDVISVVVGDNVSLLVEVVDVSDGVVTVEQVSDVGDAVVGNFAGDGSAESNSMSASA